MQIRFKAKMENGKFSFTEPSKFRQHCSKFEGEEVAVTVTKWRKPRSDNQNGYYWGVVIDILAKEFGYSSDEMHETLKVLFLTDHSGRIPKVKSTASLNTAEFEEYLSKVRMWASSEHSTYIPLPNETAY